MISAVPFPSADPKRTWLHRWIYYLAAGLLFSATALRTYFIFKDTPYLGKALSLLAAWLLLFLGNIILSRRLAWSTILFLGLEASLILYLLVASGEDFFAILFAILGMQAMQRYSPRVVTILVSICAVLTFLALVGRIGLLQALALTLIYSAVGAFMAAYIWSARRAGMAQEQEQKLVEQLQAANEQLEFHARQQEQLAAGRERQRLARELHDSVTQTIFSMTLTTQSALLLLDRDLAQVTGQLDRLDQLAQSAMAEMQELISRLAPQAVSGGGLVSALQHHIKERRRMNNLEVTLEVNGDGTLAPAEEAGLFRIAQEALNNVVKHAGVSQVMIRLNLSEPMWMEIKDHGSGFDLMQIPDGRMGLSVMRERAGEIDWSLHVESAPGAGTRVRLERGQCDDSK
jgi:signal transduction histidine kinase